MKCARTACHNEAHPACKHLKGREGDTYCIKCARRINEYNPGTVAMPTCFKVVDPSVRMPEGIGSSSMMSGILQTFYQLNQWTRGVAGSKIFVCSTIEEARDYNRIALNHTGEIYRCDYAGELVKPERWPSVWMAEDAIHQWWVNKGQFEPQYEKTNNYMTQEEQLYVTHWVDAICPRELVA